MLEFMVFLGYDGKLDAESDMEKDLFLSALDQLKERFIILGLVFFTINYAIFESIKSENTNDKARKCTYLALPKNMG